MTEEKLISLEEIINVIGDEVGRKYTWFLIGLDAQGIISEHLTIEDIYKKIRSENLGYYELSWDFVKGLSKNLSAVVDFHLIGSKSKEDFIKGKAKLNQEIHNWTGFICDFEFYIEDGEIWEINGMDTTLVERLKKTFSPLPIYLM